MKDIAYAIKDHIHSEFPKLCVDMTCFVVRNGWIINCETLGENKTKWHTTEWKRVRVEVFPEHVELCEQGRSGHHVTILPWELPELFDIVDAALKKLCEK